MIAIVVPLLVALVGLLMYGFCANAKLVRIGEILFFCGALVATFVASQHVVRLL